MEQEGADTGEEQGRGHVQTGQGRYQDRCAEHGEQVLDAQQEHLGGTKGAGVIDRFGGFFGFCLKKTSFLYRAVGPSRKEKPIP